MNYQTYNTHLRKLCLEDIEDWIKDPLIRKHVHDALVKSIKSELSSPSAPIVSMLTAEDLGQEENKPLLWLAKACAYFYTAADLLDDIQDKDPKQPVLKSISPEQAMNITNLLLMGSFRCIQKSELPAPTQLELLTLFTQMGSTMSQGQFWDIHTTNNDTFDHTPEAIARAKSGAELACFLACVPCALGYDYKPFYQLGETLGVMVQIFTDYFDIWILSDRQALSEDLLVLKNTLPLFAARQDPQWAETVDLALAGKHHWPQKQFALRRLLAQTEAIEKYSELINTLQSELNLGFESLPPLKHIQAISTMYLEQSQQLLAGLKKLKSLTTDNSAHSQAKNKPAATQDAKQAAQQKAQQSALAYLTFIPDFKDAWETHRWGFLGTPLLYGDVFNPLLILEALQAQGQNIDEDLKKIMGKSSEDGWHYYSNSSEIPTDTDDLGQILHVTKNVPLQEKKDRFAYPLALLSKNIEPSGLCPTWLCDEKKHPRAEVNKTWFGNVCVAVMANLYYGLSHYDATGYAALIAQGMAYIAKQYQSDLKSWESTHYPSHYYTQYLVQRLFKKEGFAFDMGPVIEATLSAQHLNGSWKNSPQETAFALLFLKNIENAESKPLQRSLHKGEIFLIDTQGIEGSWPGEDLFIRPGKNGLPGFFNHAKISSAFCLRALT